MWAIASVQQEHASTLVLPIAAGGPGCCRLQRIARSDGGGCGYDTTAGNACGQELSTQPASALKIGAVRRIIG
jgi:hypothetical protein